MGYIIFFILGWPFFLIAVAIALAIFIPTMFYAISNLRNGIRYLWPPKYIVGFIICSVIAIAVSIAIVIFTVWFFMTFTNSHDNGPQTSNSISYTSEFSLLFNTFKYWLLARM